MTSETERAEAAIDFSARLMAVLPGLMNQFGIDYGKSTMFLSSQAVASGLSNEDFTLICARAFRHSQAFEQAAEGLVNG